MPADNPAPSKRILFVDDEPRVLEGLRRMLYPMWNKWDMVFVSTGHRALELLDQSEFDLLITDIRMPGMTGLDLLREVARRHPQVIRYVLSGVAEQGVTLHSVPLAHQFLVKPCDARSLRRTIERALSFAMLLNHSAVRQLVSGINILPSVPSCYSRLVTALQTPDTPVREIARIISSDPAMTAKVLQLVNSAFFGLRRYIGNPMDAVMYLGLETVQALVLTVAAFSQFKIGGNFSMEDMRRHSILVGSLARRVAAGLKLRKNEVDDCLTGGLLHDVGKLVLVANYPRQYDEVPRISRQRGLSDHEAEHEVFGVTHAAVGGYLLWLWGLPDPVIHAVVQHHDSLAPSSDSASQALSDAAPSESHPDSQPEPQQEPGPAASTAAVIVRFADALIHRAPPEDLDIEIFRCAGLLENLPEWQRIAGEMLTSEITHVEKSSFC